MIVIPAIDLMDGKCVRLIQGEYHRQITYEDDPVRQAELFGAAGAEWVHVVDLDGAKIGKPVNTDSIAAITSLGKLRVEVGGGLRNEESIQQLFDLGVERAIIGTKAVRDFEWFSEMACQFENRIVLGLDARGLTVATHGWTEESPHNMLEFAAEASLLPIAAIIYTDIAKDGMLSGPNLERTKLLAETVDVPVIASGGVRELDDIRRLKQIDVHGVIAGRSLYEGTLDLAEAVRAAK